MKGLLLVAAFCVTHVSARGPLAVPEFEINLDLAPEERFTEVIKHFSPKINLFFKDIGSATVALLLNQIAKHRGPENEELMGEIRGMSKVSGISLEFIQAVQLLYELQSFMVPLPNTTISWPWGEAIATKGLFRQDSGRGLFGCTGIIAKGADGTVYHARNMDFAFAEFLEHMTYNGVFKKGGKELFTSGMIAGYSGVFTAIRKGPNGYAMETNTRFQYTVKGNEAVIKNLFTEKRETSGWLKRKVLETVDNYEGAVKAFSETPYASNEYNIVSGVRKGIILARNSDNLAYSIDLANKRYIIMTNFDYIYHDVKEWLDYTDLQGLGHSRRIGAERILNKSKAITPELLYSVLNDKSVMATDTIFQAIMNVEKGLYNTSLPDCKTCGGCVSLGSCRKEAGTCCTVREHYTLECGPLGGYRCGCLPDGACRYPSPMNQTSGDEDCCSSESHFSAECGSTRKCGKKHSATVEFV